MRILVRGRSHINQNIWEVRVTPVQMVNVRFIREIQGQGASDLGIHDLYAYPGFS